MNIIFTDATIEEYDASLDERWTKRMEDLKALQRKQEAEGVASGERHVITLEASTRRDMGVQTDEDASTFNGQAYRVLPESVKEKLVLIESSLVDASVSSRAIFEDIYSVFKSLRHESKFYTNQACIQHCLKLAVLCVERLFTEKTISAEVKKCFQKTQRMFQYYFSQANDNRAVLALHLEFRKNIERNDALSYLLQDEKKDALLDLEDATYKTTQTQLSQAPYALKEEPLSSQKLNQPSHDFSERWAQLQSLSIKPKALQTKLSDLSHEISQYVYAHKRSMNPVDWKTFLSLALAVEARLIEHMQTSRHQSNIRPLSKAMQRSAHYFRLLHVHYQQTGASKALKAELKQSYELMEARSTNYEQMLACYYVETSEKTTSTEKANARQVRASYQSKVQDDTTALCAQFRELSQPLGAAVAPKKKSKPAKEISIDDRRTLLETNLLAGSKPAYDVYQEARKYLNAVLNHVLPKSAYDVTYLHQLDNHYDARVMGLSEPLEDEELLSLALNDSSSGMLKRAVELYYDAKCRHSDALYKMHPSDHFITTERFCTHFRQEAYAFLLQSIEPGYEIENLALFKQNCLDILHAENYRAPLLEALARHQLDAIAPQLAAEATSEKQAKENHDAHVKTSTLKAKTSPPKASAAHKIADEETIWERVCAACAVNAVCFDDYLNKIAQEGVSDETAKFLYEAITNSDKRLLLDEDNETAFFTLYEKLLETHYKPGEHQALEDAKADNILHAKKDAKIPESKRMPYTIKLGEALLQYSRVYGAQRQLDCLFLLGDSYLKLLKLTPTHAYKTRAEEIYREALRHAKVMDNTTDVIGSIMDAMRMIKTLILDCEQAGLDALEESTQRENKTKGLQNHGLFTSVGQTSLDVEHRAKVMHQLGDNLVLRSHINNIIHSTIYTQKNYDKVALFVKHLRQEQQTILAVLGGHMSAMCDAYAALPTDNDAFYLQQLKKYHDVIFDYCSAMEVVLDDELLGLPKTINASFKVMLPALEDRIQCAAGVNQVFPTLDDMKKRKIPELSLMIPEAFSSISALFKSTQIQDAIELIEQQKYRQALKVVTPDAKNYSSKAELQPVMFLNVCVFQWLVNVLVTPHFKSSLGADVSLIRSYDDAVQELISIKKDAESKVRYGKNKALGGLIKGNVSVLEGEAYLQACSLFNRTDEKASGDLEPVRVKHHF